MNQNNTEDMQYQVKGLDIIPQVMEKTMKSFKQARDKIRSVPKQTMIVVVRRPGRKGRNRKQRDQLGDILRVLK